MIDRPTIMGVVGSAARQIFNTRCQDYPTHCALTSSVFAAALSLFGIEAERLPSQLTYLDEKRTIFVGFSGAKPGQWDGHVVVRVEGVLVDCATTSLQRDFGINVPKVVVTPFYQQRSSILARASIGAGRFLVWSLPPPNALILPPPEREVDILLGASELAELVRRDLGRITQS